jgi:hypothetical protein
VHGGWAYAFALGRDPFAALGDDQLPVALRKDVDYLAAPAADPAGLYQAHNLVLPNAVVERNLVRVSLGDLGEVRTPRI